MPFVLDTKKVQSFDLDKHVTDYQKVYDEEIDTDFKPMMIDKQIGKLESMLGKLDDKEQSLNNMLSKDISSRHRNELELMLSFISEQRGKMKYEIETLRFERAQWKDKVVKWSTDGPIVVEAERKELEQRIEMDLKDSNKHITIAIIIIAVIAILAVIYFIVAGSSKYKPKPMSKEERLLRKRKKILIKELRKMMKK